MRFTPVPLSLLSILLAPSSLLKRGKINEEGAAGPEGSAQPVLPVAPGIHLRSISLWFPLPVLPLLLSLTRFFFLSLNGHFQLLAKFLEPQGPGLQRDTDMVMMSLNGPGLETLALSISTSSLRLTLPP